MAGPQSKRTIVFIEKINRFRRIIVVFWSLIGIKHLMYLLESSRLFIFKTKRGICNGEASNIFEVATY